MIIFAYLLIALFFILERHIRQGQEAKSLDAGPFDQESTRWIALALVASVTLLILAPILNYFRIALWGGLALASFGLLLMLGGLALRYWAARTLGAFYTRTLLVKTDHRIVDNGPYHLIRNPGYLGNLLLFIGAGLVATNWLVVLVIAIALLSSYIYRIRVEEAMLESTFGDEYRAYKARTWKLIPLVY